MGLVASVLVRRAWAGVRSDLALALARYRASIRPRLPPMLVSTLVVAEDPRFFRHGGVDPLGLVLALWKMRLRRTLIRGGTLELRLVRILLGRGARGPAGIVRAILLSALVHRVVPKAEVPGVYLSVAYFGTQMDGVLQACRRLGFDLPHLTPLQAAAIVARLRYPEPDAVSFRRARRIAVRAQHVLRLAARHTGPLEQVPDRRRGILAPAP
jgi:penicillin-binding protein 1A